MTLREIKESRRAIWILCFIIVFIWRIIVLPIYREMNVDKSTVFIDIPAYMLNAFDDAKDNAGMRFSTSLEISEVATPDIAVKTAQDNDVIYTKFAYSPFIVAVNRSTKTDSLKKSNTLVTDEYNSDLNVLDMAKVFGEVTDGGSWENLGLKNNGELKVLYPSANTMYYDDFKKFMFVNLNGGVYPSSQNELDEVEKKYKLFTDSMYTEAVNDFSDKLERVGGFSNNIIWIMPEIEVYNLKSSMYPVLVLYPKYTTYVDFYYKSFSNNGKLIISGIDDGFYSELALRGYRSKACSTLRESVKTASYIDGLRDEYNIVEISSN